MILIKIIIIITTTTIIMIIYLISTPGLWASETDMVIAYLTPAIPINTPTFILFAILLNTQPCIFFPIALLPSLWCSFILEKCLFSVSLLYENNQHLKNDTREGEGPLSHHQHIFLIITKSKSIPTLNQWSPPSWDFFLHTPAQLLFHAYENRPFWPHFQVKILF